MTKYSTRWFGRLAIIFVVVVSLELLAFLATSILIRQNILVSPLLITEPYEFYQQRFRPTLGWPPKNILEIKPKFYDTSLSRQIPTFPDPNRTPAHVSVYGDSFTEAWGVHHEHAWSNILSMLLNCRVSNFGVAGYGTDQAYLRFLQNTQDPAKVVILGIYSNNIKRNVNQFRNLISDVTTCQTKPRFILNNQGKLTLVPIPPLSKSDYYGIQHHPDRFFHHEFFLPGGPSGRQLAKFPYLWRMFKVSYFLVKNRGRGDKFEDFYQPGHPSRGLEVTTAIIKEFCHSAQKRGKRPVILIISSYRDIIIYRRSQKWCYQPLLDRLEESRLNYLDLGPKIIQYLNGADVRSLYSPERDYHLTEEGNHLLAHLLDDFLTAKNLLPPQSTASVYRP
jgi:hypothetical protein